MFRGPDQGPGPGPGPWGIGRGGVQVHIFNVPPSVIFPIFSSFPDAPIRILVKITTHLDVLFVSYMGDVRIG